MLKFFGGAWSPNFNTFDFALISSTIGYGGCQSRGTFQDGFWLITAFPCWSTFGKHEEAEDVKVGVPGFSQELPCPLNKKWECPTKTLNTTCNNKHLWHPPFFQEHVGWDLLQTKRRLKPCPLNKCKKEASKPISMLVVFAPLWTNILAKARGWLETKLSPSLKNSISLSLSRR